MKPERDKLLLEMMLFCKVRPLARPRQAFGQRHFYQPKENQVELFDEVLPYKAHVPEPFEEPLIIDMLCVFKKGKKDGDYPTAPGYGDEDNLRKAINDALVDQLIVANDRFVIGGEMYKIFGDEDHARIQIWRITN